MKAVILNFRFWRHGCCLHVHHYAENEEICQQYESTIFRLTPHVECHMMFVRSHETIRGISTLHRRVSHRKDRTRASGRARFFETDRARRVWQRTCSEPGQYPVSITLDGPMRKVKWNRIRRIGLGLCALLVLGCASSTPPPPPPASLTITTSSFPVATVGEVYADQLAASGGVAPYTWQVAAGTLPTGVTLSASGVLAGIPTNSGSFSVTIQVVDSAAATAKLQIKGELHESS